MNSTEPTSVVVEELRTRQSISKIKSIGSTLRFKGAVDTQRETFLDKLLNSSSKMKTYGSKQSGFSRQSQALLGE